MVAIVLRGPAFLAAAILAQPACTREQTVSATSIDAWFADPRARELAAAAGRGDAERVATLIQSGADPNAAGRDGMTPLVWALRAHNVQGVRALLARGADPNRHGARWDALHVAAGSEDPAMLRALLDARGDVNARDVAGDPLLRSAVMSSRLGNVRLLIERGADVNAVGHGHETPALLAAGTDQWDTVALLLEHGADPDIPDETGGTIANTLEDEETGQVSGDPAQAGSRARVRRLLVARGVHFPADPPAVVRRRAFGPDNAIDRAAVRARAHRDSLVRDIARDSLAREAAARDSAAGRGQP